MNSVDTYAKVIWEYMLLHHQPKKSDALLVLGSIDERVPKYAAKLYHQGYSDLLIISGGRAHEDDLLATHWPEPTEAEHFAAIIQQLGVPEEKILLEKKATNTGENIQFTQQLLREHTITIDSLLVIQKPYMERRAYAAFKKQWQGELNLIVTSPPIEYDQYFNDHNRKDAIINIMVGDLQRIKEYPKMGYQIEQEIPKDVWQAWEELVAVGYTQHLIKN